MPIRDPRVFTIPAGAPFLPTFSRALVDGELIEGFPGSGGPLALAGATIYVPTQRAAAALAEALLAASGGESVLLPRIAPLGAFEPEEAAMFFDPAERRRAAARRPARGRRARPSPRAGASRSQVGAGVGGRDMRRRRRPAPLRPRAPGARRVKPRAGLCARRRSRRADRRHDHRGRRLETDRDARA